MSLTTSISFEHGKGNTPSNVDDGELCSDEIEVELEYEEGDSNYGADADGNRGISVPGYFSSISDAPDKCTECGHIYSEDEQKEIVRQMEKAAEDYDPGEYEPDPDDYEPNYDEDLYNSLPLHDPGYGKDHD